VKRLKIAIQKSGRLSAESLELLERSGIHFIRSKDKLFWYGRNQPVDLLLVRDDDIPRLLLDGVCDLGICGQNVARERALERGAGADELTPLLELDFGECALSLALPEDCPFNGPSDLAGQRIATSYPLLTREYLERNGVDAEIVELSGAVEIAPALGTADAIADLVSTGNTLRANHLREVDRILDSRAVLYAGSNGADAETAKFRAMLVQRIEGIQQVRESKYVMMHAPRDAVRAIAAILPGAETPTVLPLEGEPERVAVHALCRETVFWEHLEELKQAGASAVLVLPVEKMLA